MAAASRAAGAVQAAGAPTAAANAASPADATDAADTAAAAAKAVHAAVILVAGSTGNARKSVCGSRRLPRRQLFWRQLFWRQCFVCGGRCRRLWRTTRRWPLPVVVGSRAAGWGWLPRDWRQHAEPTRAARCLSHDGRRHLERDCRAFAGLLSACESPPPVAAANRHRLSHQVAWPLRWSLIPHTIPHTTRRVCVCVTQYGEEGGGRRHAQLWSLFYWMSSPLLPPPPRLLLISAAAKTCTNGAATSAACPLQWRLSFTAPAYVLFRITISPATSGGWASFLLSLHSCFTYKYKYETRISRILHVPTW